MREKKIKLLSFKFLFTLFFLGLLLTAPEAYANFLDNISSSNVQKTIAPLQKIPEKELLIQLKENTKNSQVGPILEHFPTITLFMVRMLRDQEALPNLAKILENRHRLMEFAYWMLGTILFGILVTYIFKRNGVGIIESFFNYIFRFTLMFTIRVVIIYLFFAAELAATLSVFRKTFF